VTTRIAAVDRRMHNTRQQLIEAEQLLADERERAAAELAAERSRRQRAEQRLAASELAAAELKRKLRDVEGRLAESEQRVVDADAQLTAAAQTLSGLHLRVRARGSA
jgi:chromosome segregation ATPase